MNWWSASTGTLGMHGLDICWHGPLQAQAGWCVTQDTRHGCGQRTVFVLHMCDAGVLHAAAGAAVCAVAITVPWGFEVNSVRWCVLLSAGLLT